jgi:hypothetical protein
MKADLRNLVAAEEIYFADQVTYTTSLRALSFIPSTGVSVMIGTAVGTGWNATATHSATGKICGIFVGGASSPLPGANEGEPVCTQ